MENKTHNIKLPTLKKAAIKPQLVISNFLIMLFFLFSSLICNAQSPALLAEETHSFWFSFWMASGILLREGLEAVLIIIIILTALQSLKAKDAIKWVHFGWLTAVAIGVASWFLTGWLISFGAKNREIMEGFGSVIAVFI